MFHYYLMARWMENRLIIKACVLPGMTEEIMAKMLNYPIRNDFVDGKCWTYFSGCFCRLPLLLPSAALNGPRPAVSPTNGNSPSASGL